VYALFCKLTLAAAGATTRYMLATLSGNPVVHTEWFWAFTFAFAVSSSYLNADDFVNMKEVVTKCLLQFAGYLAGVGIPGRLPETFAGRGLLVDMMRHGNTFALQVWLSVHRCCCMRCALTVLLLLCGVLAYRCCSMGAAHADGYRAPADSTCRGPGNQLAAGSASAHGAGPPALLHGATISGSSSRAGTQQQQQQQA
jgi:hypothetical protein